MKVFFRRDLRRTITLVYPLDAWEPMYGISYEDKGELSHLLTFIRWRAAHSTELDNGKKSGRKKDRSIGG